jgi:hypothetical protein
MQVGQYPSQGHHSQRSRMLPLPHLSRQRRTTISRRTLLNHRHRLQPSHLNSRTRRPTWQRGHSGSKS